MEVPGKDNEELYRETLQTIREAIGPERYLLGCWGIPTQGMSIMDGSRTGGDVVLGWSGFDVALMPTMRYYYQHNIVWYTDPDVMMLRQPLTLQQAQVWATLQGLTGQALMTSDRLPDLFDDRIELLKKVYPAVDIRPVDLFPTNKRKTVWDLKINHLNRQYDVVGLFNFEEKELKQHVLKFSDIGLNEKGPYHIFDFWNNEYLGAWEKSVAFEVPPTSCRVITIMPDNGEIQIVSTNRHITQGWIDLKTIEYYEQDLTYSGKSNIIKNNPYQIHFAYPRGQYYEITDLNVKGVKGLKTKIANHQGWSTIIVESPVTTDINWSVSFKPAYSYKYNTREPGRLSVEAVGLDAVKLSWGAQYYLNSGYQVYLDDELFGYSPATYIILENLNSQKQYTADVRTVWKDGDVNITERGDDNEITIKLENLVPREVNLTGIKPVGQSQSFSRPATLKGIAYPNSIITFPGNRLTYNINGMFSKFSVKIGVDDNSRVGEEDQVLVFVIEGDGKIIYRSKEMKLYDEPLNINVDLKGIDSLTLVAESHGGRSRRRWGLMGAWVSPVINK